MLVHLKSNPGNDRITSLNLQQGQTLYEVPLKADKPLVYGSFTLEPAEMGLHQRIEGNIKRQFVGEQHSSIDRKECTFSGICKYQVEKEENNCIKTGADTESCTKTKKMADEFGSYDKCPGWENYETTYQDANYHLTLRFFALPQDKIASATFEGMTAIAREKTSSIKTKNCNDSLL
jgi:hypothetical protein